MPSYPDEIYEPREIENRPEAEYDPTKKRIFFAEDHNFTNDEIVAIENFVGLPAGQGGKIPQVKATEDGFEYVSPAVTDYPMQQEPWGIKWTLPGWACRTQTTRLTGSVPGSRFIPIFVSKTTTFDRIAIEMTIASGAGTKARLGVYNSNPDTNNPDSLILDAGTVAMDGAIGVKEIEIDLTLQRGYYYLVICFDAISGTLRGMNDVEVMKCPIEGLASSFQIILNRVIFQGLEGGQVVNGLFDSASFLNDTSDMFSPIWCVVLLRQVL